MCSVQVTRLIDVAGKGYLELSNDLKQNRLRGTLRSRFCFGCLNEWGREVCYVKYMCARLGFFRL